MNYKKLNEVDVVESMSDSDFVLGVDDNGGIKRVPKSTMGKIKTINGAEPDENGNIEVVGGNENLARVGVTEFIPSAFQLPDDMTGTINISAGREGEISWGSWINFDEYLLVNFDGTDYTCKVSRDGPPPDSWATAWAGNYSLCDSTKEDTGEPFFVYLDGDMQSTWWWIADNSVEHTAICRTGKFVTGLMPEEYLPLKQPTIKTYTIPYVVESHGLGDNRADNITIGGYTAYEIGELIKKGYNVSFLQTPKYSAGNHTPPLLYTLSGGDGHGSEFIFTAIYWYSFFGEYEEDVLDDVLTTPPYITGFWWDGSSIKTFKKTLALS